MAALTWKQRWFTEEGWIRRQNQALAGHGIIPACSPPFCFRPPRLGRAGSAGVDHGHGPGAGIPSCPNVDKRRWIKVLRGKTQGL